MIGRNRLLRLVAVVAVALAAGQLAETLRAFDRETAGADLAALDSARGPDDLLGASLTGVTPVAAVNTQPRSTGCEPSLRLAPLPGAMIDLQLSAPCNRGHRVLLRQSGLDFTALIGPTGQLRLQVPALEHKAMVAAYLDSSEMALATVTVPDAEMQTRFALQLATPAAFTLKAGDGGPPAAPGDDPQVILLGAAAVADPILAQVYTHPGADLADLALTVTLHITPENCGRVLPGETILSHGGTVTRTRVSITVPPCGTSDDTLVLKNLFPDPTLGLPG